MILCFIASWSKCFWRRTSPAMFLIFHGNGIIERCHWSVKRIVIWKQCLIIEIVCWYNIILKDNITPINLPANMKYHNQIRVKRIDANASTKTLKRAHSIQSGRLWVKNSCSWCTLRYQLGYITGVSSPNSFDLWMKCCTAWNIFTHYEIHHIRAIQVFTSSTSSESARVFGFDASNGSSDGESDVLNNSRKQVTL